TVFWPQSPPQLQDLCECLVRLYCGPSSYHGERSPTKDWLKVLRRDGGWEVQRIAFRVIDQGPDVQWRQDPRWVNGLPEGEQAFIRQRATSTVIGPWRVGREIPDVPRARELIPHPNAAKVFEYAVKDLDSDSIYSGRLTNRPSLDALLYTPDE